MKSNPSDIVFATHESPPAEPTHEQVAMAAYMIWKNEGDGDPLIHWLKAEKQLRDQTKNKSLEHTPPPEQAEGKRPSGAAAANRGKRK